MKTNGFQRRLRMEMNDSRNTYLVAFARTVGLLIVLCLAGCVVTNSRVNLVYEPQTNVSKVEGAGNVKVTVQVNDVRKIKNKVGRKKKGISGSIVASGDVTEILGKAIEVELGNRGFLIQPGNVIVVVELSKFYNDFKEGFWSGTAVAEVTMKVEVKKPDESIVFSKVIAGTGNKTHIELRGPKNAKAALEAALKDALSKLTEENTFTEALVKAGTKQ